MRSNAKCSAMERTMVVASCGSHTHEFIHRCTLLRHNTTRSQSFMPPWALSTLAPLPRVLGLQNGGSLPLHRIQDRLAPRHQASWCFRQAAYVWSYRAMPLLQYHADSVLPCDVLDTVNLLLQPPHLHRRLSWSAQSDVHLVCPLSFTLCRQTMLQHPRGEALNCLA